MHCGLILEDDLNKTLKSFWEVENLDVGLTKSKETTSCEEHFEQTHFRNKEGRYVVTIPLKEEPSCLGESRDIALKRLNSLWHRLSKDQEHLRLYKNFLDEYERLGHMSEVKDEGEPESSYYMPHHGVYRPEKSTTKLRVVFNASSLTHNATSFNAIQYNGGVIQEDLFSIMTSFRRHTYAFQADIKMMYRMILVNPKQHCLQRILWKDHANGPTKAYELRTITYDTVSASFLATRCLNQLSLDEGINFPLAAPLLRDNFYMDDVLYSAPSLDEAKETRRQLISILDKAGLSLHKWSASHPELSPSKNDYDFSSADETKTLGVIWRPSEDCYTFKISVDENNTFTKRSVLSTIAKLFEPLGIAGPVIAKAKIFMQKLWKSNIDWGDPLPAAEFQEWSEFISTLKGVNNIKVDRCITIEQSKTIEFHGFADASESCYGAVVYCKSFNSAGDINVKLVASKSRVAPLKALSIPRLELCAAVLLSKLMKKILSALKLQTDKVYLWSDSMIVLAWIQKEPTSLKTFVKNRIALIQELTLKSQWNHVPSEMNPADLISRGLDPVKLLETKLWWKGPNFLYDNEYPNQNFPVSQELSVFQSELKKLSSLDIEGPLKAFTLTFSKNCRNPTEGASGPLSNEEINASEQFLLRVIQNEEFGSEIRSLKLHEKVSPTSKIRNLNPLLDSNGVLRVGGRLGNTELNFLKKHPAILPKNSPLTSVIISTYHLKYLHIGPNGLLNCVREKFWPLCGRSLCRRITHNCVVCVKNKPIAATQIMGNLPREKVVPDFAFNCSGVDLTGPFSIKCKHQRKAISLKMYICLFICFVSKAVHIEIVSDLTSESKCHVEEIHRA
nr:uncharacterized protein LOC122272538 [Parasteatoda tepidariorum]